MTRRRKQKMEFSGMPRSSSVSRTMKPGSYCRLQGIFCAVLAMLGNPSRKIAVRGHFPRHSEHASCPRLATSRGRPMHYANPFEMQLVALLTDFDAIRNTSRGSASCMHSLTKRQFCPEQGARSLIVMKNIQESCRES